ncbi:MAG: hypothetical protein OES13_06525 [Acidimicrobiia bacterium]|nr:hypothetical protein [Acidimicrobiia bacterium]
MDADEPVERHSEAAAAEDAAAPTAEAKRLIRARRQAKVHAEYMEEAAHRLGTPEAWRAAEEANRLAAEAADAAAAEAGELLAAEETRLKPYTRLLNFVGLLGIVALLIVLVLLAWLIGGDDEAETPQAEEPVAAAVVTPEAGDETPPAPAEAVNVCTLLTGDPYIDEFQQGQGESGVGCTGRYAPFEYNEVTTYGISAEIWQAPNPHAPDLSAEDLMGERSAELLALRDSQYVDLGEVGVFAEAMGVHEEDYAFAFRRCGFFVAVSGVTSLAPDSDAFSVASQIDSLIQNLPTCGGG